MESRLNELLGYLHELAHVQASGHYVNEEIKETIKAVRQELGFEEVRKEVKDSSKLIYDKAAGDNFDNHILWEAIVEHTDRVIELELKGSIEPVLTICKLFSNVKFVTKDFKVSLRNSNVVHFDKTLEIDNEVSFGDIIVLDQGVHCEVDTGRYRVVRLL